MPSLLTLYGYTVVPLLVAMVLYRSVSALVMSMVLFPIQKLLCPLRLDFAVSIFLKTHILLMVTRVLSFAPLLWLPEQAANNAVIANRKYLYFMVVVISHKLIVSCLKQKAGYLKMFYPLQDISLNHRTGRYFPQVQSAFGIVKTYYLLCISKYFINGK